MLESSNPPSEPRRRRLTRRSSRDRMHQPSPPQLRPTRHSPDASANGGNSTHVKQRPSSNLAIARSDRAALPPVRSRRPAEYQGTANSNVRFNLRHLLFGDASRQPAVPKREVAPRLPEVGHHANAQLKRLPAEQRHRNVQGLVPTPRSRRTAALSRQKQPNVHALVPRRPASGEIVSISPTPVRSSSAARSSLVHPKRRTRPASRRAQKSPSTFVYATRLLIFGVGVSVIAGTFLSVWSPAVRHTVGSTASEAAAIGTPNQTAASLNQNAASGASALALASLKPGRNMTDLATQVRSMVTDMPELTPGVFLMDLDTGNYLDVNGTSTFAAASMIKVPVLVAFLQDVDAGKIRLDEVLTIREADVAEGSGEMQYQPVGTQFTALETAIQMIAISDNTATNMLVHRMGGTDALNQRFRQWGLQTTTIHSVLPDLQGTNITTPKELSNLLVMVSQGNLLSLRSRDRLFEIMRQTVTNTLLPAGIGDGEGALIAHKTGDIGSLVGDTGVVDLPNGKRYVVTIMMRRPHNDDRAQELIRQIANVTYQAVTQPPSLSLTPAAADGSTPSANADPQAASPADYSNSDATAAESEGSSTDEQ